MPPILAPEKRRARSVQADPVVVPAPAPVPADKPSARGFVAAVPMSPAPFTPLSPPALQPPPPSHYLRNRNRNSEGSDLFRKRSEIYTRVQRVLPPVSYADDSASASASGLLFGSDFHANWTSTRLARPPPLSPRLVVATPIHAAVAPAPPSAEPPSSMANSNANSSNMPSPRDEGDDVDTQAQDLPSSVPHQAKERASRRPFRTLLRERLTVIVRSRSVEAASAAQPVSSTDDLSRHSTELGPSFNQQFALAWPPSPGSSTSSVAYESSFWSNEADNDKKSVSSSASQSNKALPLTPPSPNNMNLYTPPSAPIGLLEAQKVRRAKAFDQFTRYGEATPFPFQRSAPSIALAAPVPTPVLALHSAREIPTEMQQMSVTAIEVHRVSSVPDLRQHFQPAQPQPLQSQSQPQSQSHRSQLQSAASSVPAPRYPPSPPLLPPPPPPPLPALTPHAPTSTPTSTTTTAPEGKSHRTSCHHRKSTGVIPSVGSLKAILRPRSHSKAALAGTH